MDEKCVLLFPLAVASSEAGGAEEQGSDTSASNRSSNAVEELVLAGPEEDHTVLGLAADVGLLTVQLLSAAPDDSVGEGPGGVEGAGHVLIACALFVVLRAALTRRFA